MYFKALIFDNRFEEVFKLLSKVKSDEDLFTLMHVTGRCILMYCMYFITASIIVLC